MRLSQGQWYIDTREGIEVGPFCSKSDAIAAAEKLTSELAELLIDEDAMTGIKAFDIDASIEVWSDKPASS